mgnify:CR=1 FL=1
MRNCLAGLCAALCLTAPVWPAPVVDLDAALKHRLSWDQQQMIDTHAPTHQPVRQSVRQQSGLI